MQRIITVSWIILWVYWFVTSLSVKPIRERKGWLGGNWYGLLLILGFLFMVNFDFLFRILGLSKDPLEDLLIPAVPMRDTLAAILTLTGLVIAIVARHTLAGNWSRAVAIKQDHELITTGLYSRIRHPIYSGLSLMVLGTAIGVATLGAAIGFLVILFGFVIKLRDEEALLSKHFPGEYESYRQRTNMLIPFVW